MFQQLHDAIPENGSVNLTLTRIEDGKLCATVTPRFPEGGGKNAQPVLVTPFSAAGSVEEFEVEFAGELGKWSEALRAYHSNLAAALDDIDAKTPKGAKAKASAEPPDRTKGKADDKQIKTLSGGNGGKDLAGDEFQAALRSANLKTLEAALSKASGLTRQKLLAREIHEVGGKEIKDILVPILAEQFKANQAVATNPALDASVRKASLAAADRIGEEIEMLTGKGLDNIGLDPAQCKLVDDEDDSKGGA